VVGEDAQMRANLELPLDAETMRRGVEVSRNGTPDERPARPTKADGKALH
jgi:hypothetical protein